VFRTHHLPALRAAGVQVQVLAVWVDSASLPEGALRAALRLIDVAHREADASQGALRIVASTDELDEALRAGAVAGILSLEGAEPLGRDPGLLRLLRRLGVRLLGPAWNRANAYVEGAGEDTGAGLTALGGRLLAEMAEAGVALDVSHLTERGALEALERFDGPALASHSNAAAVHRSSRNVSDRVLRALAERDGVCGLNVQRVFLGPGDVHQRLADHHAHLVAVGGPSLPAIGADFVAHLPPGPAEPADLGLPPDVDRSLVDLPEVGRDTFYAEVAATLEARAVARPAVDAVLSGNALRVLRRVLEAGSRP
jgi:membrane dipeptidase